jgi:hypothetical protein
MHRLSDGSAARRFGGSNRLTACGDGAPHLAGAAVEQCLSGGAEGCAAGHHIVDYQDRAVLYIRFATDAKRTADVPQALSGGQFMLPAHPLANRQSVHDGAPVQSPCQSFRQESRPRVSRLPGKSRALRDASDEIDRLDSRGVCPRSGVSNPLFGQGLGEEPILIALEAPN